MGLLLNVCRFIMIGGWSGVLEWWTAVCRVDGWQAGRRPDCGVRGGRLALLILQHLSEELCRAPEGLGSVVDEDVEVGDGGGDVVEELLDGGQVLQVEAKQPEVVAPGGVVGLAGVGLQGRGGEPGGQLGWDGPAARDQGSTK